jgi:hypothetical protein
MVKKNGRPLKYPDEDILIQKTKEYIATTGREQTSLPTIEGLALYLDLDDERISEYAKRYSKFHATIKALKAKQKGQLMDDGLYGGKEVNSTMAIFLLKVNHGMIETEKKLLGNINGESLTFNIIADGFSRYKPINATSGTSDERQTQIQDNSVAQTSKKDNNSNN